MRGDSKPDNLTLGPAQAEFDALESPTAGAAAIRGSALRVTGYLVGVLLTVVSAAVLFRYLGPDDAGKYVTVLAIVAIVGSVFDGGLHSLAIREASVRRGADRSAVIGDLLGMRLVMGAAAIVLASAFALVLGYEPSLVLGTALASLGLVLWSTNLILAAPLVAALRLGWVTSIDLFRNAGAMVLILAGVWAGSRSRRLPGRPDSGGRGGCRLDGGARPPTRSRSRLRFGSTRGAALVRDVVPYALATAAGLLYFRVAVVLLSLVSSAHETGLYSAAFRTVEVLLIVPQLAVSTVLPIFAHAASRDRERLAYGVDRTFRAAAVFGGGLAVVLALGAPFAIAVVAGPDFGGAADMLRIQALGLGVALVTSVFTYALLSLRMHRELLFANLAALGVSVVLTLALGSAWGGVGAATATAIAEVCLAGSAVWLLVRRHPALRPAWSFLCRVFAAGLVAGALALIPLPSLVLAVAGAAVYTALAFALRAVPQELLVELGRVRQVPQRSLVAVEGRRRSRLPAELLRPCGAGASEPIAQLSVDQQGFDRSRNVGDVRGVEVERGVPGDLLERADLRAGNRNAAHHRFEDWQAEALRERWEDEARGGAVQAFEHVVVDPAEKADSIAGAALQLGLEDGLVPGRHEHRVGLRLNASDRLEQPLEVLVRPLRRDRKDDRGVAELEAAPELRFRNG